MRVAGSVVSECPGAGGVWREPSSVKQHEEETESSGLGPQREGCKSRRCRHFQVGSIPVASCPTAPKFLILGRNGGLPVAETFLAPWWAHVGACSALCPQGAQGLPAAESLQLAHVQSASRNRPVPV